MRGEVWCLRFAIGIASFLSMGGAYAESIPTGYVVHQTVALDPTQSGVTGSLQILEDHRITDKYREGWGYSRDPGLALGSNEEAQKEFPNGLPRHSVLRLIDHTGHELYHEDLEVPLARIETHHLYGTGFPTHFVIADYGIGMGSYAGPIAKLAEIRNGRLSYLTALDPRTNKAEQIQIASSLKNAWKIVSASAGKGGEIEVVQSHPNFANPTWEKTGEFVTIYSTIRFDGHIWQWVTRQKLGIWEADGYWPKRAAFP